MLILAGVSISAIVGEDGIITKAQSARYLSGMAALEEYLQETYVQNYEDEDEYTTKPEMLNDVIPNLLLTNSTSRKYIIYEGNAYYLINKQSLPSEIQDSLVGGNSNEIADISKLIDVYGVTNDLKVYYIDKSTSTEYGNISTDGIDPNIPMPKLNSNQGMRNAITNALEKIGVEVDSELGITAGNISSLKNLILDGSVENVTDISSLSECTSLRQLTLKNMSLDNINSLAYIPQLEYVYFYNCNIQDYSGLASVYKLKYLYFYFTSTMSTDITNAQISNLGQALSKGQKIDNLQFLYIVGDLSIYNAADNQGWNSQNRGFYTYASSTLSNLTDISGLSSFSSNIKSSIKEIYLNNHKITSISALSDFYALSNLILMRNPNLTSLSGLENKTNLLYIGASYCGLSDLQGISGCTNLIYLLVHNNPTLISLKGLEKSANLVFLYAQNCNLKNISALEGEKNLSGVGNGLDKITYLNLSNNSSLINVGSIAKCDNIRKLYLDGCTSMDTEEFKNLNTIINLCGNNYTIPSEYYLSLSGNTVVKLTGNTITDTMIDKLTGNTNVTRLSLQNCNGITNAKLNSVLSTMTNLKYVQLLNCSGITSISFVDSMTLVELDLNGTNVVDLSPLNDASSANLATLRINKDSININSYTTLLTNLCNNSNKAGGTNSWISESPYNSYGLIYNVSNKTIVIPSGATRFYSGSMGNSNVTYDLSACTSLKYIHVNGNSCRYILPASLEELFMEVGGNCIFDFSRCVNLVNISRINGATDMSMNTSFQTMPENNKLSTLRVLRSSLTKLEFLEKFNANKLTTLEVRGWTWYENVTTSFISTKGIGNATALKNLIISYTYLNDLTGMENLKSLTNLTMTYNKLIDISSLSGCTALKEINLSNNSINNISSLKDINTITKLYLNNNNLSNLIDFSNLNLLNTLNVSSNSISSLSYISTLIRNNATSIRTLNLSNNPLEDYASDGYDNHATLINLKNAGCTSISINETSLSSI